MITQLPIGSIVPNPDNPRVLKDERFELLKKSIQSFPDMLQKRPLVVVKEGRKKYVVLGGNARLKACVELGIEEVPVIIADDWSEEQRRQFIVKDNVSTGDWDMTALQTWNHDELREWGVGVEFMSDVDVNEFFEGSHSVQRPDVEKLILKYSKEDLTSITTKLQSLEGTPEQIIFNLVMMA